jgi:hypothetical protein
MNGDGGVVGVDIGGGIVGVGSDHAYGENDTDEESSIRK